MTKSIISDSKKSMLIAQQMPKVAILTELYMEGIIYSKSTPSQFANIDRIKKINATAILIV